ncbi:phosphoribosylamine--glycine ligase [Candidatus Kapabacteria bacterium]|nr:phosphoribosylamine--glycine ligase [Candidatus Kapabacteria bacterium]
MINTLLIGSGGRENSLAKSLKESDSCGELYASPGNPGILEYAKALPKKYNDFTELSNICKEYDIKLVVVGPEQPLAEGIADELTDNGIAVFGPSKNATKLESSKSFAKSIMTRANVPTAEYKSFDVGERTQAIKYIKSRDSIVIKADGLAGGKGVLIPEDELSAIKSLNDIFDGKFGNAGSSIVIEEFMEGEEASVFAICDGENFVTLSASQDHKRALDDDKGLNTGGMGAYAPAKIVTKEIQKQVDEKIIKPVLKAMSYEGNKFIGCLYCGLMIKDGQAKVVEFNVRFGDPETQSVLSIFEGDLCGLFYSAANGNIDKSFVKNIQNGFACNVVLASDGYPESYEKGFEISGIDEATKIAEIYHAGTKIEDEKLITNGGRVLAINGRGNYLEDAINNAYLAVSKICFTNINYRTDIGQKGLK